LDLPEHLHEPIFTRKIGLQQAFKHEALPFRGSSEWWF
jgi:hypothetical protein